MNLNAILNRIAMPIRILVVVGVFVGIAYSIFDLMSPAEISHTETGTTYSQPAVNVENIVRVNLFGSEEQSEEFDVKQLEKTTLNLTLVSVVFDEVNPDLSWARIAQGSQKAKKYSHGDRIQGIANLSEVLRDRVILERLGQRELLSFDSEHDYFEPIKGLTLGDGVRTTTSELDSSGYIHQQMLVEDQADQPNPRGRATTESEPRGAPPLNPTRQRVESFKQRLEDDPEQVLKNVGLTPVSSDNGSGYKINGNLAKQFGLRSGDILTSINGEAVGNQKDDLTQMLEQLNGSSVNVQVKRGDELMNIEIQLDQ